MPWTLKTIMANTTFDPQTGCLNWNGWKNQKGYALISEKKKTVSVARKVYEYSTGKNSDGFHILHRCDNPSCCNPEHIFLGTNWDNIQDKINKDRSGKKLLCDKAREIKYGDFKTLEFIDWKQREIGAFYGIHQTIVSRIKHGDRWNYI